VNRSYRLFVLAILFALGVACWSELASSAQEKAKEEKEEKGKGVIPAIVGPPPSKWEYKIMPLVRDDQQAEQEMNKLGDEGWELVGTTNSVSSSVRQGPGPGGPGGAVSTRSRLIFKRPKK
jgi:hypothetical protein